MKKILKLTINKEWFSRILSGEKTEEYREIKPYWAHRLIEGHNQGMWVSSESYFKPYTHVLFINGYRKDSPRIERRLRVYPSANRRKVFAPISGLILSFLSLNSSDMNYIQCDECKYRLVCNGEPLTSGSTGSCDHRVISNTPIFPKIKTPLDERYADIWNW